jgi:uncharacterized protein
VAILPRRFTLLAAVLLAAAATLANSQLPALGAGGLLHPWRRAVMMPAPDGCVDATFAGAGVTLKGWQCRTSGARRGAIVYLHGVADNRTSALGVVHRFVPRGFDVIAYDSRAHGESDGEACTYGVFEKHDLRLVLNTLEAGPIVLVGTSLGAAVALQHAADDERVSAVVAAETFSDLRTIVRDRVPFFITTGMLQRAFDVAEERGAFRVDEASPARAAAEIAAPVLLIHGEDDLDTPPAHSQRVFAALKGPKRLMLVRGAAHNGSLRAEVWEEVHGWLDTVLGLQE